MTLPPALAAYAHQALELALMAVGFFILALLVKGVRAVSDARAATAETKNNLVLYVMDTLTVAPALTFATSAFYALMHAPGAVYAGEVFWARLGPVGTVISAVVICDFLGYCNHRLFHTSWLWPSHAIHHSDTHLTWFSLLRMHPFDRLGTLIDLLGMILLGLPDWAMIIAVLVRHYYGHLIHADLPWTLGKLNWVFISPAMHRWHHALEYRGSGVNFATVFSVFDRMFGTFYAPGVCNEPTGVPDKIAPGLIGQYLHPARTWAARLKAAPLAPEAAPPQVS
jgi:sterol desaturase/sphingolipid hydroxylase (fatty acid hydroxylase superfamily)